MTTLTSSLIVKLVDALSAPAKKVASSLGKIGEAARKINGTQIGGSGLDRLGKAAEANGARMDALRGKMLDAVAAGYVLQRVLGAPLQAAREFESTLLDIGQKGDLSDEAMKGLGQQVGVLAGKLQKSVSQLSLLKGVDLLAGFGMDNATALKLMEPIAKVAVAYKAEVEDLAKSSFAVFDNLKVPVDQVSKALNVMAQSGKEGAFELKDMAREFPVLTAAAQALKMTGVDGVSKLSAALQIARKGAATGAEAATNTANLMQKIISPETTKKFKKVGIDVRKELKKVQEEGGDIFEWIAGAVTRATKGDMSKLGDFFQDSEVQKFLRPLIQNLDEYRKIRDKSKAATGVVDEDFERRLKTGDQALAQFKNRMDDLARTIGSIILPAVNQMLAGFGGMVDGVAGLAERFPNLTKGLVLATAGLVGFRIAAIAAAYSATFLKGAWLSAALAMGKLKHALMIGLAAAFAPFRAAALALVGTLQLIALRFRLAAAAGLAFNGALIAGSLATFGRALLGLLRPLALVAVALRAIKFATIATGWGAALVGLAAAGTWVYKNWSNIGAGFKAFRGAYMREIKPILNDPAVKGFVDVASKIGEAWDRLTGEGKTADFQIFGQGLAKQAAAATREIVAFKARIADLFSGFPKVDLSSLFEIREGGDWIGTLAAKAREGLASLGTAIVDGAGEAIAGGKAKLQALGRQVMEGLSEGLQAAGSWAGGLADKVQDGFAQVVSGLQASREQLRAAAAAAVQGLSEGLRSAGSWASGLAAKARESMAELDQAIRTGAAEAIAGGVAKLAELGTALVASLAGVGEQLRAAGAEAMQGLMDGMKSIGESIASWASGLAGRIVGAFSGMGSRIRGAFGGGGGGGGGGASAPAPAAPPARARGGRVSAGELYQVNEEGVELFRPNRSGTIETASRTRAAREGAGGGGGGSGGGGAAAAGPMIGSVSIVANGVNDPDELARQVMSKIEGKLARVRRGSFADVGMRTA